jgi:hypothetical protein
MNVPLPVKVISSDKEWRMYLCEHVPALEKLWQQGKFEQFESYKILSELDYNTYLRSCGGSLYYAPCMPLTIGETTP